MINTKNSDNKGFLWCHLKHLNPLKIHPERITKADKMVNNLEYEGVEFLIARKANSNIEKMFVLMYFVMKIIWFILFIYQIKNLKALWIFS